MPAEHITLGPAGARVAANVRALRTAGEPLAATQLARLCREHGRANMHDGAISLIERGVRRVDVDDLAVLCEVLGVDADDMLHRDLAAEREEP